MRRSLVGEQGQDLVEFALLLPLLLLFILGIVEFGVAVFAYNTIANAAREGARVGVVLRPDDPQSSQIIKDAVVARTGGLNLTSANITATLTSTVTVEVVYHHQLITGLIVQASGGGPQVQLRSVATMRSEIERD